MPWRTAPEKAGGSDVNIVLIGYRGTGKTTIGRMLSAELGMPYVSLDEEIVKRVALGIPEMVARYGWEYFRDREEEAAAAFAGRDGQVLDTGGGVVTRPVNIERLKRNGLLFLLEARIEDIVSRIGSDTQRPSLTGTKTFTEEAAEVLAQRTPLYRAAADHAIDTSTLSAEEAARQIAALYRQAIRA
jgi:shikimate kinase